MCLTRHRNSQSSIGSNGIASLVKMRLANLLLAVNLAAAGAAAPAFQLDVTAGPTANNSLGYTVSVDGTLWLEGSPLKTLHLSGNETPLAYKSTAHGTDTDAMGSYLSTAVTWDVGGTRVITEFREYRKADPAAIVFSLQFPDGAPATARPNSDSTPLAAFPAFASEGGMLGGLGYRSWSGNMCADAASMIPLNYSQITHDPNWLATINSLANGPMALYEEHDGTTLFISPHSEFMTEQHRATPGPTGSLSFGPVRTRRARTTLQLDVHYTDMHPIDHDPRSSRSGYYPPSPSSSCWENHTSCGVDDVICSTGRAGNSHRCRRGSSRRPS